MNSHCQPLKPRMPSSSSSSPETGDPITVDKAGSARRHVITKQHHFITK
jgi:hypothetical protein